MFRCLSPSLNSVSNFRHVVRSMRISRTTHSCSLHAKGYVTYRAGREAPKSRGQSSGKLLSFIRCIVVLQSRIPLLELLPERAVEGARSRLQHEMRAGLRPLHLLTFAKAFAHNRVDGPSRIGSSAQSSARRPGVSRSRGSSMILGIDCPPMSRPRPARWPLSRQRGRQSSRHAAHPAGIGSRGLASGAAPGKVTQPTSRQLANGAPFPAAFRRHGAAGPLWDSHLTALSMRNVFSPWLW